MSLTVVIIILVRIITVSGSNAFRASASSGQFKEVEKDLVLGKDDWVDHSEGNYYKNAPFYNVHFFELMLQKVEKLVSA